VAPWPGHAATITSAQTLIVGLLLLGGRLFPQHVVASRYKAAQFILAERHAVPDAQGVLSAARLRAVP
jgi:hypothetical protein